jgi:adenine-specific DNA methylase
MHYQLYYNVIYGWKRTTIIHGVLEAVSVTRTALTHDVVRVRLVNRTKNNNINSHMKMFIIAPMLSSADD